MPPLRSLLWIGGADGLGADRVAEAPDVDVAWAPDAGAALELPLACFDALVLDAPGREDAEEAAARLASAEGAPPLLVRLPGAAPEEAERMRRAGARSVLTEPHAAALEAARALGRRARAREDGEARGARSELPAPGGAAAEPAPRSRALRATLALVERAQRSEATVLLTGETGTGKERLARAIHEGSARRRGPFVAANCAALPASLLESELFGHVRGAFTGADRDRRGLFEEAAGGTLLLDEVAETEPALQAKLLRALQEREVRPVGGGAPRKVETRVVAATNRDLRREVAAGRFRADLYYRLAVFPIAVPPLRERPADLLPLARHFLERFGRREGKPGLRLAPDAARLLLAHRWPGNVRELENEMQRAVALAEPGATIEAGLLSERLAETLEPVEANLHEGESLRETLQRVEAWLIRRALERNGGRRAETARRLGITREGLYKKMQRLGIG